MKKPGKQQNIITTSSYTPPSGESAHSQDLDYIRTNIPCQWSCPVFTDIPGYINAIHQGDYRHAYEINRRANLLPGTLGRICSRPCEKACRHGEPDLGEPVAICHLKRLAADNLTGDGKKCREKIVKTGKKIAVVGAGPAGLAASHSLTLFGHQVSLYEGMPKLGGMLIYGIPDFRVPEKIVEQEIADIISLGITVHSNKRLGSDIMLEELQANFDAVVLALGCYKERRMGADGEDLEMVYSGLDFMMKVNQNKPLPVGKKVAVLGGGFTAMDCARSALRLGAEQVGIYIRRTESDSVVTRDEIHETKCEGIAIESLVAAQEIIGENGRAKAVRFTRNRLVDDEDGSGKIPVAIAGSDFVRAADTVIIAIGQSPEKGYVRQDQGKTLSFDYQTGGCDQPGLFFAGDFLCGASTVIDAIGHAKNVAAACDHYLTGKSRKDKVVTCLPGSDTKRKRSWDFLPRNPLPTVPPADRFSQSSSPDREVELGYDSQGGKGEASRCYLCNLRYAIHLPDCIYCRYCIDVCPRDCIYMTKAYSSMDDGRQDRIVKTDKWNEVAAIVIDSDRCIRCGECLRICPTQCIHVTSIGLVERFIALPEDEDV